MVRSWVSFNRWISTFSNSYSYSWTSSHCTAYCRFSLADRPVSDVGLWYANIISFDISHAAWSSACCGERRRTYCCRASYLVLTFPSLSLKERTHFNQPRTMNVQESVVVTGEWWPADRWTFRANSGKTCPLLFSFKLKVTKVHTNICGFFIYLSNCANNDT